MFRFSFAVIRQSLKNLPQETLHNLGRIEIWGKVSELMTGRDGGPHPRSARKSSSNKDNRKDQCVENLNGPR